MVATNAQPLGVIARLLDLSERRVQQLSREGVIPKAERGQYDLVAAVRGYVAYLRDLAVKAQSGAPDLGIERARLINALEAAWTAVLVRLRARLLVLPDRLAPLCHEETTIAGFRDQIRRAVREDAASSPLVAADPDGLGAAGKGGADSAVEPAAATVADDKRLGRRKVLTDWSLQATARPGRWQRR